MTVPAGMHGTQPKQDAIPANALEGVGHIQGGNDPVTMFGRSIPILRENVTGEPVAKPTHFFGRFFVFIPIGLTQYAKKN